MFSRRPLRSLALLLACALALFVSSAPVVAQERPLGDDRDAAYLALGDSVAFGFNPLLDPHNAANFVGYPEALAHRLDLDVTNASCPGEASGGFVSITGTDNLCRPYRAAFPLHVAYPTTESQLDFAVGFLRDHPRTRLVTLQIGANDLFVLQKQCVSAANPTLCVTVGLPALVRSLANNLQTIYGRIRGEAHYRHQIVGLTYYATNFNDPVDVPLIQAINATLAEATRDAHGQVADGFDAFRIAARRAGGDACAAGLLIVTNTSPLTCDIHPSPRGRDLLADAIAGVVHDREDD
jgi:lysophospholipase L1-like esterase